MTSIVRYRIRTAAPLVAATALALALPVAASAEPPQIQPGCYAHDYAPGQTEQDISHLQVVVGPNLGPNETQNEVWQSIDIDYQYQAVPTANFGWSWQTCSHHGSTIRCGIECDGGSVKIRPLAGGELLVESDFSIRVARVSSLALGFAGMLDLGLRFTGTHILQPRPAWQCLDRTSSDASRVMFQAGDYHDSVKNLTTQLSKLGHLALAPGNLYTDEVADAVRNFQSSLGLAPTGKADVRTIRMLNVYSTVSGGC